jgi:hypothetical protein
MVCEVCQNPTKRLVTHYPHRCWDCLDFVRGLLGTIGQIAAATSRPEQQATTLRPTVFASMLSRPRFNEPRWGSIDAPERPKAADSAAR